MTKVVPGGQDVLHDPASRRSAGSTKDIYQGAASLMTRMEVHHPDATGSAGQLSAALERESSLD